MRARQGGIGSGAGLAGLLALCAAEAAPAPSRAPGAAAPSGGVLSVPAVAAYLEGWADAAWAARRCYGISIDQDAHAARMEGFGLRPDAFAADPAAQARLRAIHAGHEKQAVRWHGAWCGKLLRRFDPEDPAPGHAPELIEDRR